MRICNNCHEDNPHILQEDNYKDITIYEGNSGGTNKLLSINDLCRKCRPVLIGRLKNLKAEFNTPIKEKSQ